MQYLKKNCVPLGAPLHTSKLVFQSRQGASRGLFGCHDRQFCTLGTQHQSQNIKCCHYRSLVQVVWNSEAVRSS